MGYVYTFTYKHAFAYIHLHVYTECRKQMQSANFRIWKKYTLLNFTDEKTKILFTWFSKV